MGLSDMAARVQTCPASLTANQPMPARLLPAPSCTLPPPHVMRLRMTLSSGLSVATPFSRIHSCCGSGMEARQRLVVSAPGPTVQNHLQKAV